MLSSHKGRLELVMSENRWPPELKGFPTWSSREKVFDPWSNQEILSNFILCPQCLSLQKKRNKKFFLVWYPVHDHMLHLMLMSLYSPSLESSSLVFFWLFMTLTFLISVGHLFCRSYLSLGLPEDSLDWIHVVRFWNEYSIQLNRRHSVSIFPVTGDVNFDPFG